MLDKLLLEGKGLPPWMIDELKKEEERKKIEDGKPQPQPTIEDYWRKPEEEEDEGRNYQN